MKLRKGCEHGRYEAHGWDRGPGACPGGEFLADDALIIEKVNGEFPSWCYAGATGKFLDALTVRQREGAE